MVLERGGWGRKRVSVDRREKGKKRKRRKERKGKEERGKGREEERETERKEMRERKRRQRGVWPLTGFQNTVGGSPDEIIAHPCSRGLLKYKCFSGNSLISPCQF